MAVTLQVLVALGWMVAAVGTFRLLRRPGRGDLAALARLGPDLLLGGVLAFIATSGLQLLLEWALASAGTAAIPVSPDALGRMAAGALLTGVAILLLMTTRRLAPAEDPLGWRGGIGRGLLSGALAYAAVLPVVLVVSSLYVTHVLGGRPEDHLQESAIEFLAASKPEQWVLAVVLGLCVPLYEEILFRGWIQGGVEGLLRRVMGPRAAALLGVVIGASAFAVMHDRFTWPVIFLLGLFLGGLYARTRSLWAPVAFHVTHNLYMVMTFVFAPPGQGS